MKKQILILALVIGFLSIQSQTAIELTFTAVYEEQYVPLDSIFIENLTQPGEMMVYSDTVVNLQITGVYENSELYHNDFIIYPNFPNPAHSSTSIRIYVDRKENFNIRITDMLGRQIISSDHNLKKGMHLFKFIPGNEKVYLFTATTNNSSHTIKITNFSTERACNLIYKGFENKAVYKSGMFTKDFPYNPGDELKFTGYSRNLIDVLCSDVIIDIPEGNEFYTFITAEGIACPEIPWFEYEGQVYNTVQIGDQCWMHENLNTGTMIQSSVDQLNVEIVEKYCFDNNANNCDNYGGMYQ